MAKLGIVSPEGRQGAFAQRLGSILGGDAALDIAEVKAEACLGRLAFEGADEELVRLLEDALEELHQAGADAALVASVSAHCTSRALAGTSPLPLLDLAEALRQDVLAQGWRSVFVLGSYRTMKGSFLKRPLILAHKIVITPSEDEKLWLQQAVEAAPGASSDREALRKHLQDIVSKGAEEGADGLLLASTALESLADGLDLALPAVMPASAAAHALGASWQA